MTRGLLVTHGGLAFSVLVTLALACGSNQPPVASTQLMSAPATGSGTAAGSSEQPATTQSHEVTAAQVSAAEAPRPGRDPQAAVRLANEGDQLFKLDLQSAIGKYRQALEFDPENPLLYWKLGYAYQRQEDFANFARCMQKAAALDPESAHYWQALALALTRLGEGGDTAKWSEALAAATRCLELDPLMAECEWDAALAEAGIGNADRALAHHRTAIASDRGNARYHVTFVALLLRERRYGEARSAIAVANRDVEKVARWKNEWYRLELQAHELAVALHDSQGIVTSLENADAIAGQKHPELALALGKAYLEATPPRQDDARRVLRSFVKRVCNGAARARFENDCSDAERRLNALP